MESEEFEQIPWANLVAEHTEGIDKRVYMAAGLVGLLVVAVLGMRLLGGGSQPVPPAPEAMETPPPTVASTATVPPTSMVVAEADLMAEEPALAVPSISLVHVTAEWFVIDWFTRDGSEETIRSIRAALSPDVVAETIPHEIDGEPVTFVEWAKVIESNETDTDSIVVTVAYRAIHQTDEGFVRDPVETVTIELQRADDSVQVVSLPIVVGR